MKIVLFATAWGFHGGGINAFNFDLARGLAKTLGPGRVYCAVPDPKNAYKPGVVEDNVALIPVHGATHIKRFDEAWCADVIATLITQSVDMSNVLWVGHDVYSGHAALKTFTQYNGKLALIHHMHYQDYLPFIVDDDIKANEEIDTQRELFRKAATIGATLFGVGPLLTIRCRGYIAGLGGSVNELIPGFPEEKDCGSSAPTDKIVAMVGGRLDKYIDPIKQGRLAVAAMGRCARDAQDNGSLNAFKGGILYMIGAPDDTPEGRRAFADEFKQVADNEGRRMVRVLVLPYIDDRRQYLQQLQKCNVVMMLSFHEGFGLAGWEAIACGIPLIVGGNTGLVELALQLKLEVGKDCLKIIPIEGHRGDTSFSETDIRLVTDALQDIGKHIATKRGKAQQLKKTLREQFSCTWANTSELFVAGCRLAPQDSDVEQTRVAPRAPRSIILTKRQRDRVCDFYDICQEYIGAAGKSYDQDALNTRIFDALFAAEPASNEIPFWSAVNQLIFHLVQSTETRETIALLDIVKIATCQHVRKLEEADARKAGLDFEQVTSMKRGYWAARRYKSKRSGHTNFRRSVVRVNDIPFAEAIFGELMSSGTSMGGTYAIALVRVDWDDVEAALRNRWIDVALHNGSIVSAFRTADASVSGKHLYGSNVLLEYNDYPVLEHLDAPETGFIAIQQESDFELVAESNTQDGRIKLPGGDRRAIPSLVKTADEALERLFQKEVQFCLVGGVQHRFASRLSDKIKFVGNLNRNEFGETRLRFWVISQSKDDAEKRISVMVDLWNEHVVQRWAQVRTGVDDMFAEDRERLVELVNTGRPRAFVSDFKELADLITNHDGELGPVEKGVYAASELGKDIL